MITCVTTSRWTCQRRRALPQGKGKSKVECGCEMREVSRNTSLLQILSPEQEVRGSQSKFKEQAEKTEMSGSKFRVEGQGKEGAKALEIEGWRLKDGRMESREAGRDKLGKAGDSGSRARSIVEHETSVDREKFKIATDTRA